MVSLLVSACSLFPPVETYPLAGSRCIAHLSDIHGQMGGFDLQIFDDGSAWLREVRSNKTGIERRYRATLHKHQIERLKEVIVGSGFLEFRERQRYGIPDEARPRIQTVIDGKEFSCAKWDGDEDARFSQVYEHLLQLAARISNNKPVWVGKRDYHSVWPRTANSFNQALAS